MSDLKRQLIKLGSTNPELRPHIREVLANLPKRGSTLSGATFDKIKSELNRLKDEYHKQASKIEKVRFGPWDDLDGGILRMYLFDDASKPDVPTGKNRLLSSIKDGTFLKHFFPDKDRSGQPLKTLAQTLPMPLAQKIIASLESFPKLEGQIIFYEVLRQAVGSAPNNHMKLVKMTPDYVEIHYDMDDDKGKGKIKVTLKDSSEIIFDVNGNKNNIKFTHPSKWRWPDDHNDSSGGEWWLSPLAFEKTYTKVHSSADNALNWYVLNPTGTPK